MVTARGAALSVLGVGLAACTLQNLEYDAPTEGDSATSGATTATTATTTMSASASASSTSGASGGASASGTSSSTGESTGVASDAATTSTGDSTTTSADSSESGDSTTTTTTTTGTTSTTGDPDPVHLQHYDPNTCTTPLWCHGQGNIFDPRSARNFGQECFQGVQTPFRITNVDYVVVATYGDPYSPALAFREYVNGNPAAEPFATVSLSGGEVTPGAHSKSVDVSIASPDFCVGFAGGLYEDSALGMAVDSTPPPKGQSWYKSERPGNCDIPSFLDIAVFTPTPTGTWCIGVDIEPL